ncbi:MAG: SGNH/GDSL hydrolase family protein [Nitrospirota bacterium]|nr:SGNH/GDSL hydrolase family protein [Nitrospirota bacterium]
MALTLFGASAAYGDDGLGTLVVVGDSLSAGYQNSSLLGSQQKHGFASLVAEAGDTDLTLPLIAYPGVPPVLELKGIVDGNPVIAPVDSVYPLPDGTFPPRIEAWTELDNGRHEGWSRGRHDGWDRGGRHEGTHHAKADTTVHNLAVPGHTVLAALGLRPNMLTDAENAALYPADYALLNVWTNRVLGDPNLLPMSQVERAMALDPDTLLLWIGGNDVLWVAVTGKLDALTDPAAFAPPYTMLLGALATTGARVAVANLVDITVIPFLTPAEQVVARVAAAIEAAYGLPPGSQIPAVSAVLGIGAGDYLNPLGLGLAGAFMGAGLALPDEAVVDAAELATVQAATSAMNAHIAAMATATGSTLVDVNGLMNDIDANGYAVGGQVLTTDFLGGLFTLDGIHPTNTAHAVLANAFIDALNTRYGTGMDAVDVLDVALEDPLIFVGLAGEPEYLAHPQGSAHGHH